MADTTVAGRFRCVRCKRSYLSVEKLEAHKCGDRIGDRTLTGILATYAREAENVEEAPEKHEPQA